MSPTSVVRRRVTSHRLRRAATLAAIAFGLTAAGATLPALASAANPLTFAAGHQASASVNGLGGVSCPSTAFCVAGIGGGIVEFSTTPASTTTAWTDVKLGSVSNLSDVEGVSCPTTTFCVAVDEAGYAWHTTSPTSTSSASWTENSQLTTSALNGVACPSATICAAATWSLVGGVANEVWEGVSCPTTNLCTLVGGHDADTLTNLAAGATASVVGAVNVDFPGILEAVSCASGSFCLAVDGATTDGYSVSSTNLTAPSWSTRAATQSAGKLSSVACPLTSLCVAGDGDGDAYFTTAPGAASPTWTTQTSILGGGQFESISCPQSGFCIAGGGGNYVSVATGATLSIAPAGTGTGTITDSDAYINCGATCSAYYAGGSTVTLTEAPAAGDTFTGWSGGGCSGTATTCTVTNGAAGTALTVTANFVAPVVVPPAPNTLISKSKINSKKHTAKFTFSATGTATSFECAILRKATAKHKKGKKGKQHVTAPIPVYTPCTSPKTYKHLKAGSYTFYVSAIGPGGTDSTPATKAFKIR
jgi:hypothetical protein